MKILISIVAVFLSTAVLAAPVSLENCLTQKDQLDREYCQKKRLRAINKQFEKEFGPYRAGYSQAQKNNIINKLNADIAGKKAQIDQLNQELKINQDNLSKINAHLSHEEHAANKENSRRAKRKKKTRKLKKLFKKIF